MFVRLPKAASGFANNACPIVVGWPGLIFGSKYEPGINEKGKRLPPNLSPKSAAAVIGLAGTVIW